MFRASLATNGIEKYLNIINNYVALYNYIENIKCKKAPLVSTSLIMATKTAIKQLKTVKMAQNSQFLGRPPLGTNGIEKYLKCIINSCVII